MKTISIITTLLLTMSGTLLLADNDPIYPAFNSNANEMKYLTVNFYPITPKEADFEEVNFSCIIPMPASFFTKIAPVIPKHADFDDDILPVHIGKLIPALPMEADF